jgi:hypothetical protein
MKKLRVEFAVIEDKIVSMLLGLVNGKIPFTDLSGDLASFRNKVKITRSGNRQEDSNRNFFLAKINSLKNILTFAEQAHFTVKLRRAAKAAVKT